MKKKTRQILAIIGITLLLLMYIVNIVLALIGSDAARDMLKGTMVMSIAVPILLYALLVLMQKNDPFRKKPEDELTEEQKQKIREMIEKEEG